MKRRKKLSLSRIWIDRILFRNCDVAECLHREHLRDVTQRMRVNLNPESSHDENGFRNLAERVPLHDFASNAGISRTSQREAVFPKRTESIRNLAFSFKCSIVQMFFCFLPQSPLFEILASQGENKDFHPHRAPHEEKL